MTRSMAPISCQPKPSCRACITFRSRHGPNVHGKPLNDRGLATRLRKYGVKPRAVRIGESTPRGYVASDLADVWERYVLPTRQEAQQAQQRNTQQSETRGATQRPAETARNWGLLRMLRMLRFFWEGRVMLRLRPVLRMRISRNGPRCSNTTVGSPERMPRHKPQVKCPTCPTPWTGGSHDDRSGAEGHR